MENTPTSSDIQPEPKSKDLAKVRIILTENTLQAKVVGSCPALGRWCPQSGIKMLRVSQQDPQQSCNIMLPKNSDAEFKFVKKIDMNCPDSGYEWEPRAFINRHIHVTSKENMQITCKWGDPEMKIEEWTSPSPDTPTNTTADQVHNDSPDTFKAGGEKADAAPSKEEIIIDQVHIGYPDTFKAGGEKVDAAVSKEEIIIDQVHNGYPDTFKAGGEKVDAAPNKEEIIIDQAHIGYPDTFKAGEEKIDAAPGKEEECLEDIKKGDSSPKRKSRFRRFLDTILSCCRCK